MTKRAGSRPNPCSFSSITVKRSNNAIPTGHATTLSDADHICSSHQGYALDIEGIPAGPIASLGRFSVERNPIRDFARLLRHGNRWRRSCAVLHAKGWLAIPDARVVAHDSSTITPFVEKELANRNKHSRVVVHKERTHGAPTSLFLELFRKHTPVCEWSDVFVCMIMIMIWYLKDKQKWFIKVQLWHDVNTSPFPQVFC